MAVKVPEGEVLATGNQIGGKGFGAGQGDESFIHEDVIVLIFEQHVPVHMLDDFRIDHYVDGGQVDVTRFIFFSSRVIVIDILITGLDFHQPADLDAVVPLVSLDFPIDGRFQVLDSFFKACDTTRFLGGCLMDGRC